MDLVDTIDMADFMDRMNRHKTHSVHQIHAKVPLTNPDSEKTMSSITIMEDSRSKARLPTSASLLSGYGQPILTQIILLTVLCCGIDSLRYIGLNNHLRLCEAGGFPEHLCQSVDSIGDPLWVRGWGRKNRVTYVLPCA